MKKLIGQPPLAAEFVDDDLVEIKSDSHLWRKDKETSNEKDNFRLSSYIVLQELSIFGESFHGLESGYLVREVVAVDLEPLKLRHHFLDAGQKFHFMRRSSGATVKQAHAECVAFIKMNVSKWMQGMNKLTFHRSHGRTAHVTDALIGRQAASFMALALHALQDSFSPGHTKRELFSNPNFPGSISDIYVYSTQDHHKHGKDDFESGSMHSVHAKAAIIASSEMLYLAAQAVANKSGVENGWLAFEKKWLQVSSKAK